MNAASEYRYDWPLSWWLTVLIVLAIAFLCAWTYGWFRLPNRGNRTIVAAPVARGISGWVLPILRWLSFMLVLWMLSGLSVQQYQTDSPELMVLIDRSASMSVDDKDGKVLMQSADLTASRLSKVRDWLQTSPSRPLTRLEKQFRLRWYAIGDRFEFLGTSGGDAEHLSESPAFLAELEPDDSHSRLGDNLRDALAVARGRATSAIVVFSDGIVTDGWTLAQAAHQARQQLIPLYLVAVGEETLEPDLRVIDLAADATVFAGDSVAVQANVTRQDIEDGRFRYTLSDVESGEVLDQHDVAFPTNQNQMMVRAQFLAKNLGTRKIRFDVESQGEDRQPENNSMTRTIEIRDAAIPVLMVFGYPSYEFRFLKHLLERTRQHGATDRPAFRLTAVLEEADPRYADQDASAERYIPIGPEALHAYDVIIVGDVSPQTLNRSAQQALKNYVSNYGGGLLAIAGPRYVPDQFQDSVFASLLPIEILPKPGAADVLPFRWELTPIGESSLPLQLEKDLSSTKQAWSRLPLQQWRTAGFRPRPLAQTLATAQDAQSNRDPILVTQFVGAGRVAFQATDETFQWQSFRGDDLLYQRYWVQMVRWLSRNKALQPSEPAKITVEGKAFQVGEMIRVAVELNEETAEQLAGRAIRLKISRDREAAQYVELLPSASNPQNFEGTFVGDTPGRYQIQLDVASGDSSLLAGATAELTVLPPPGEFSELRPAYQTLKEAADIARGKYYRFVDVDRLLETLPVSEQVRLQPLPLRILWNQAWVPAVLLLLLTAEWLGRRRQGLP